MLNYLKVFSGFQTFGLFDFWKMMSKRKLSCWFIVSGSYVVWGGVHPWKLTWNTQKLVVCIDVSPFPRGYVQVSCWFFGCVCCYMLVSLYISGDGFHPSYIKEIWCYTHTNGIYLQSCFFVYQQILYTYNWISLFHQFNVFWRFVKISLFKVVLLRFNWCDLFLHNFWCRGS